ncbi:PIN domain-containing protein [Rariglobus hedericola]|uniref:PIN-like domain-containing protein n=1 Tax=Rariglobus hedericola TaxID=2597822 RepID=A0A556QPD9_9BACT|nr:PIN domain-containing protein [Rariglobus hedericola]TSJ78462.1 hypothetical protein FPL22_03950 [Rariglobus hedericola]
MHTDPAITSRTNHVFVDFENVHEVDHSVIGSKTTTVTILLGPKDTKLDVGLVEKLLAHAASVQLVRLTSSGKNALDFTLAYYVGRAAITDPEGYFHIISRDAGFDPLIQHLRSRHIRAHRHPDFSSLSFSCAPKMAEHVPPPPSDDMTKVLEHLRKNTTNRPKRKTTLTSHLLGHLGKNSTEAAVGKLIAELIQAGHLSIGDKGTVSYSL